MPDYYDILGISRGASQDEIKAAFRRLAMEHHPDRGGDQEKFKNINEAYQTLGDSNLRAQYDQYGATFEQMRSHGGTAGFEGFRDWASYAQAFDFGDLNDLFGGFGDIFSSAFGFGKQAQTRQKQRGRDLEMTFEISFEESIKGAKREIDIDKIGLCERCAGSGAEPGSKITTCLTCGGKGKVTKSVRSFFGNIQTIVNCSDCRGEGKKAETPCGACRGKGAASVRKKLLIKIPAGISDGEVIRLSGEGEEVGRGGRAGDFYLNIRVKPHKEFERRGNDIWSKADLDFKTAALGGKIEVNTVDGQIELKIPVGTQSGQIFKLKNLGAPDAHRGGRGSHFVEVRIYVPERLSKRQREILEEWE